MLAFVNAIGWAVLHALWQATLLGATALLWLHHAKSSTARYHAAAAGLMISVSLFFVTFAFHLHPLFADAQPAPGIEPILQPIVQRGVFAAPDLLSWVGCAWLVGVSALLIRYVVGWQLAHCAYIRRGAPASHYWRNRVASVAGRHGVDAPLVLQSAAIGSPAIFGVVRPVLVLPASGLERLDDAQLDGIIVHELTHVQRRDTLANLLQCIGDLVFFFHPAVRLLSRLARAEREHICDTHAVQACGNPRTYVSALLQLEESRAHAASFVMPARAGSLLERARQLLRPRRPSRVPRLVLNIVVSLLVMFVTISTVTLLPTVRQLAVQAASVIRYTVTAHDPAGRFRLAIDRGRAVYAEIGGAIVPVQRIRQVGDSVFVVDERGVRALAVQVRPDGGIGWSPRSARSSL